LKPTTKRILIDDTGTEIEVYIDDAEVTIRDYCLDSKVGGDWLNKAFDRWEHGITFDDPYQAIKALENIIKYLRQVIIEKGPK
jgi:hypothetical protein